MGLFEGLNDLTEEEEEVINQIKLPLYNNLATCFLKLNEPSKVIQNALKALKIDANNAKAYWRLGRAQLDEGNYEDSKQNLYKAAKLEPQNKDIRRDIEELNQDQELEKTLEGQRHNPLRGIFNKPHIPT